MGRDQYYITALESLFMDKMSEAYSDEKFDDVKEWFTNHPWLPTHSVLTQKIGFLIAKVEKEKQNNARYQAAALLSNIIMKDQEGTIGQLKVEIARLEAAAEESDRWIGELSNNAGKLAEENVALRNQYENAHGCAVLAEEENVKLEAAIEVGNRWIGELSSNAGKLTEENKKLKREAAE